MATKKDEQVEKLMEDLSKFDFSFYFSDDLEKWKQGINKEYLIKKDLDLVIKKYGVDKVSQLEKAVRKAVPKTLINDLEDYIITLWFMPYHKINERTKDAGPNIRLQSHRSIKTNVNDRS